MVDDFGFDVDLGFDATGFDATGFDAFAEFGGLDPSAALTDAFALHDAEFGGVDAAGFDLDFDPAGLGSGSDLEDVVFAPDLSEIVDFGIGAPGEGADLASALEIDPTDLAELDLGEAMGGSTLRSPFLPEKMGGAALAGGGTAAAAVPYGLGSPPTDTHVFNPSASSGRIAAKLVAKGVTLLKDTAYDQAKAGVAQGAKSILGVFRPFR